MPNRSILWHWPKPVSRLFRFLSDKREYRQSIAELRAYSDLELADLGLARGQIEHAVKNGRPG